MTDNDTSFLLKELNTLSYDGSIHLIYELLQKIHAYDRIAKILHEQNAQLRIRNPNDGRTTPTPYPTRAVP